MSLILYFLLILIMLIFSLYVHEFGHFLVAKLQGVKILRVRMGIKKGPVLFKINFWNTEFDFYLLPFSAGIEYDISQKEGNESSIINKPDLSKILITLGGPLGNFLYSFSLLLFIGMFWHFIPINDYIISNIEKAKDITKEEYRISDNDIALMQYFRIYPDGFNTDNIHLKVVSYPQKSGLLIYTKNIGIEEKFYNVHNIYSLIYGTIKGIENQVNLLFYYIGQLLTGKLTIFDLRGYISYFRVSFDFISVHQLYRAIWLGAFFSLNMGIFNLLPLPTLDGGIILITIFHRKINNNIYKKLLKINSIILSIISVFIIFIIFNDFLLLIKGVI